MKALAENNCLVHEIVTDRTPVLHCMKLRLLMPGQHLPDVQNAPQEQKFGTDVILKDVGFYPTAWKWEYEKSIFGDDKGEPDIPNSFENTTRLD